jgi:hypothetical protein
MAKVCAGVCAGRLAANKTAAAKMENNFALVIRA